MTKKYTLTTSEETVTENPEDIIRLMKLAGLENAQPVAEEVEAEVYEPTEANDKLDLDDYSKKSPEVLSTSAYDNRLLAACKGLALKLSTLAVIPEVIPVIVSSISN